MKILAVETSCDETSVSVLEVKGRNFKLLSNIVASQVKIHAPWGGVVPNLAKREHQKNLPIILKKALKEAKLSNKNPAIDLIAVTSGPGLEPALWVGINFTQELAEKWQKSLLGVNHLEGHAFSVFLKNGKEFPIINIQFPILALIVSGGHTELVLMEKWLKYKRLGETLDDAAGEAFDKVARILKLGYPGGPVISKAAEKFSASGFHVKLPRPMFNSKDYNFSFSGLKTAALYLVKDLERKMPDLYANEEIISAVAKEFQQSVVDVLIKKTMRAIKEYKAKTVILGGGVAANKELRRQLQECTNKHSSGYKYNLLMPELRFTGDNAAMIALAAYFRISTNKKSADSRTLRADGNLKLA